MKYTEEQLQRALVEALPEKIYIRHNAKHCVLPPYLWVGEFRSVTPYEWPAIVGMVEETLGVYQMHDYTQRLAQGSQTYSEGAAMVCKAKWPIRAQALADIGAITVKE